MSGIVINEDDSHFFYDRGPEGMTEKKMLELVGHYCQGQATEIVWNVNAMRSSVSGLTFPPIWEGTEDRGEEGIFFRGKKIPESMYSWIRAAKKADDLHLDPYRIWVDETRKRGRKAVLSLRMNDLHCVDDEMHFMHSEFWREHPEFRREVHAPNPEGDWYARALDFMHPEVREYTFSMFRSMLEKYDCDGIELDWMRFGPSIAPGQEDAGREVLTEFHRQARAEIRNHEKIRSHRITLSVRVPTAPQEAFDMGYDVFRWAQEALIDEVVPSPFFMSTDFNIPIALWRRLLPESIVLSAGLELLIRSYRNCGHILESLSTLAGQAANYLYQGADKIYLFNHMDSDTCMPDHDEYQKMFHVIGELKTAAAAARRHLITHRDRLAPGSAEKDVLPLECPAQTRSDFLRLEIGPKPEEDRSVTLILGALGEDPETIPEVWMNDRKLEFLRKERNAAVPKAGTKQEFGVYAIRQKIPAECGELFCYDARNSVKEGRNVLFVRNNGKKTIRIGWTELEISGKRTIQ